MPAKKKASAKSSAKPNAKAPWGRDNPKQSDGRETTHLSPGEKAEAKRSAKKAGRPYPNLVDNMRVAKKKHD